MTSDLTNPLDVAALLRAVHDALDIPLSHWDDKSRRGHYNLLIERAGVARIVLSGVLDDVLSGVLDDGHGMGAAIDYLNERVAETPVTYRLYVPEPVGPSGTEVLVARFRAPDGQEFVYTGERTGGGVALYAEARVDLPTRHQATAGQLLAEFGELTAVEATPVPAGAGAAGSDGAGAQSGGGR